MLKRAVDNSTFREAHLERGKTDRAIVNLDGRTLNVEKYRTSLASHVTRTLNWKQAEN